MIAYTVTCEFADPAVAAEWIGWLRDEHLRDVCEAGAIDAEVVRLDRAPGSPGSHEQSAMTRCEARYHFATRETFAAYERDHAPRLRAEGLRRFSLERGLRYSRSAGVVEATFSSSVRVPQSR